MCARERGECNVGDGAGVPRISPQKLARVEGIPDLYFCVG